MLKLTLTAFALISSFTASASAHAKGPIGLPIAIRCTLHGLEYKEDINEKMNINDLMRYSKRVNEVKVGSICQRSEDGTSCQAMFDAAGIHIHYKFSNNGGLFEVYDAAAGLSAYSRWDAQEEGKSAYVPISNWLTNLRGGLMGSKRIFQVEAECAGSQWE